MAVFALTGVQLTTDLEAEVYLAKEAIAAGLLVSLDDNNEASLADATDTQKSQISGIALATTDANNVVPIVSEATIQVSNALTKAQVLILATAGQVQLESDLTAGQFLSILGANASTNTVQLAINNTNIQK